nr:DUF4190 domain-containing protein [Micromonospora siamensis]
MGQPPAPGGPDQPPPYGRAGDEPPSPYEPPSGWQPYGPPPPYGQHPGQWGPRPGMNVLAVLSLVFAFLFSPAGIVLGHLARRQIRQTGEEGEQLAFWGLILSYVFTALGLLACCGWIAFAFWAGSGDHGTYR